MKTNPHFLLSFGTVRKGLDTHTWDVGGRPWNCGPLRTCHNPSKITTRSSLLINPLSSSSFPSHQSSRTGSWLICRSCVFSFRPFFSSPLSFHPLPQRNGYRHIPRPKSTTPPHIDRVWDFTSLTRAFLVRLVIFRLEASMRTRLPHRTNRSRHIQPLTTPFVQCIGSSCFEMRSHL